MQSISSETVKNRRKSSSAFASSALATVTCPSCFAPLFKGSRFCPSCGAEATRESVLAEGPDLVVVATGASPVAPAFLVEAGARVVTVWDLLSGAVDGVPDRVAVLDDGSGFWHAISAAEYLAEQGAGVELLTPARGVGLAIPHESLPGTLARLRGSGVRFRTLVTVTGARGTTISLADYPKLVKLLGKSMDEQRGHRTPSGHRSPSRYSRQRSSEPNRSIRLNDIIVSTMNDLPGYRVTAVHGEICGLICRSRNGSPTCAGATRSSTLQASGDM